MSFEGKVSKIGNKDKPSLYVIIPAVVRKELNILPGDLVEVKILSVKKKEEAVKDVGNDTVIESKV
jgi:antitoxin component of MazEF toxin-antitoxin module